MSERAGVLDERDLNTSSQGAISGTARRSAGLDHLARGLLFLLPVLFVVGRAPADVAVSVIALLFLARSQFGLGWQWLKTPWIAAVLLYWLYLILVSTMAISPGDSFGRAVPFVRFILLAAAMQHWLLADERNRRHFLAVLAAVAVFVALDCLLQLAIGHDLFGKVAEGQSRLSGPFDNDVPGTFLAKVSLPLLGCCFAFGIAGGRWPRLAGAGLAAALMLVIMVTGERSALFTYGLGVALLMVLTPRLRAPLLAVMLVGALAFGAAITTQKSFSQRFIHQTIADIDDFWGDRYGIIYVKAFKVWESNPWFGTGLKNFRLHCDEPNFAHQGKVETWCFTHPHNPYLELMAETGAIGLLLFLGIIVLWLKELWPRLDRNAADFPLILGAALAVLVMFLWPVMIAKSLFSNWNAILFWLMFGLALALAAPRAGHRPGTLP